VAALEMLNILSLYPMATLPPRGVEELHFQMEAMKLAYADLHRFVADPRFSPVPVAGMLSMDYARQRAGRIDPEKASCQTPPGEPRSMPGDTIYLAAVDREGNIVSLIQSLYQHFGSGVVVDDYGFALHNRGALFTLDEHHPNALAPRKRPFHTIIPAFMEKGETQIGFGIMGGMNQAMAHAQFVVNLVDHGMNIQAALEAPRFTKLNFGGCDVQIEARVTKEVRDALTARGHQFKVLGDFSSNMGGGQVVVHDAKTGVNYGASSPRKDGAAVPEPAPYWQ
jgi:gamma-glutamyltranspeptidase/glutathione hydrolase